MIFERGLDGLTCRPESVLTVGTFDGVHLGHRAILSDIIRRAKNSNGLSTLVTFDPHPREVLLHRLLPRLTTVKERADLLASLGLGRMIVLPFTEKFSEMSAEDFVTELLVKRIGLQSIVVGHDHRFGKGRTGDIELLASMGEQYGFDVNVIGPQTMDSLVVSSRKVRHVLREKGDVSLAAQLLGRPYCLTGTVIRGDSRGRELGYATANLALLDPQKILPAHGIYAVSVLTYGALKGGMMSIGTRPAVKDSTGVHLEVHLFDFNDDIYGEELNVHFLQRIREERYFPSMAMLKAAMQEDEIVCREVLEQTHWDTVPLG